MRKQTRDTHPIQLNNPENSHPRIQVQWILISPLYSLSNQTLLYVWESKREKIRDDYLNYKRKEKKRKEIIAISLFLFG